MGRLNTIFVPLCVLGTGGLWLCVPVEKKPKLWGVHVVPYYLYILLLILSESIDKNSYIPSVLK